MYGEIDQSIRTAAISWLLELQAQDGEVVKRRDLERGFILGDRRIQLMSPRQGIWKPAVCDLPLSMTTTLSGPYSDAFDRATGRIRYSYRGTDPNHRDNVGLRRAMQRRVPLIYFHPITPGHYLPMYPVYVVGDDPTQLTFYVQVDDVAAVSQTSLSGEHLIAEDESEARRAYITTTARRRLHQVAFRERVLHAYHEACALCMLRHRELLDAAHITPDVDPEGDPVVANGLALCKLHHAAFDRFFFAVRPDYSVEVRASILSETDGPMLIVGLQAIHGQRIHLPARSAQRPDQARLERRYALFRQAS